MNAPADPVTLADWQQLRPAEAARILSRRLGLLTPEQRRAVFAELPGATELEARFEAAASAGGPLRSVPYVLKDLFDVVGQPTRAGSAFLAEVRPTPNHDSLLVQVLRTAGAVLAGKTHLHEFAYGLTGENPHYGDCEHPRFPGRTSGGSSSGSAVAVAAGITPFAIGTDTGGSIRVPAAFCGLYGLRMTPHHPWIADGFPLAESYDTAGWFTRTAADMRKMADALLEPPANTPSTRRGCWLELPGMDPEVAEVFRKAAGEFAAMAEPAVAAELRAAFAPAAEVYGVLGGREVWAVHQAWADRFAARYDPVVRGRLDFARRLTFAQIAEAEARSVRLRETWSMYFKNHDFLVLPATPCVALSKAQCTPDNRRRLLAMTAPVSLGGLPVLVVPIRLASGLSTALQIVLGKLDLGLVRELLAVAETADC